MDDLLPLLDFIDPVVLSYQEWCSVGMALKHEGYTAADWESWSLRDAGRYHSGECEKKWKTFNGAAVPVTGGTIVDLAKKGGWSPQCDSRELDWDDIISRDELVVVNKNWLENKEVHIPEKWDPVKQLIKYLETLFSSDENVGYVTRSYEQNGRYVPTKGCFDRTAGQLIEQLGKCNGDVGAVLGDYDPAVGAWIRFNPLDGKGVKNENVTDYRFALVESDNENIDRQNAILRELELPIACLVHSGNKSLHAIVKVEASGFEEYRKRVDYLYRVCEKNGLEIDTQNRNTSRLSRMPGVMRGGNKQYLLDTNIGKKDWNEWYEWIEAVNDDMPEPESMAEVWDNLPELAPALIDGILRQGHKMLLAGPSKAGKSFALIELCCALAEGKPWFGFNCAQGRVLYVNLELDRASCLHRFKDVYTALQWTPEHLRNIDIWNLRGRAVPMDKLAPKLIRRAAKKNYIAIIIDPIYKIITGDENSADQMAAFCNQFDKVCTELNCAVIYCHHHSKGAQGGKRSMDRASGSGVFARDPDALLDLIELPISEELHDEESNKAVRAVCRKWLERFNITEASQDDECNEEAMLNLCRDKLSDASYRLMRDDVNEARARVKTRTAWRIEGTLREYPKFAPVNLWFDFPVHTIDYVGVLKDVAAEDATRAWNKTYKMNFKGKKSDDERKKERMTNLENAFNYCAENGKATVLSLVEHLGKSEKTVRRYVEEHAGFWIDDGEIGKK